MVQHTEQHPEPGPTAPGGPDGLPRPRRQAGVLPAAALVLLGIVLGSAGSLVYESRERGRVNRLEARVDSFAVTLTQVVQVLSAGRGGEPAQPESLTVGAAGAGTLGSPDAPVTIVEFTDYQCPFCARHVRETWPELRARYVETGKVRYVVRDLPLPNHAFALPAAIAARCARAQSDARYWLMHDGLFAAQDRLSDSVVSRIAREAGMDIGAFDRCRSSADTRKAIEADLTEANRVGLGGTPGFVVGRSAPDSITGIAIRGAYPVQDFERAIARAGGSSGRLD